MPRPKPKVPVDVPFYARTTQGEREALNAILERRHTEDPVTAHDLVTWLRRAIRREAEELGIPIVEPEKPETPTAKPTRKTSVKRGR